MNMKQFILLLIILSTMSSCTAPIDNQPDIVVIETEPMPFIAEDTEEVKSQALVSATPITVHMEYDITLNVDPVERMMTGIQRITYTNNSDTTLEEIYMHLHLNAFSRDATIQPFFPEFEKRIFQAGRDYGYININQVTVNREETAFFINNTNMRIELNSPLAPGASIDISLLLEAYIPVISHRTGANAQAMWLGNFLPKVTVYDQSGWHVSQYYPAGDPFFSETSNYNVNITVPSGYTVISTGNTTVSENNDMLSYQISASMVRDFAFVIGQNYNKTTLTSELGTEINFYYYSDIPDLEYYMDTAKESLEYLNDLIGPYPYPSINIVETELFFRGGMEYPQIIFMDSEYLRMRNRANSTIVHEIVHQWFYNIIGNDQINSAWLDEGLATLVQELFLFNDEESFQEQASKSYTQLLDRINDIPNSKLNESISIYNSWSDYYNVQYVKGKLMFYALREKMGYELFKQFLKTYYGQYSFRIAYPEDIFTIVDNISDIDSKSFFDPWLNENGLPELEIP